jgi:hypothetical protein
MRPLTRRAFALVAAAAAAAAFAGPILKLWDPDAFHHLAMGRHVVRHGLGAGEPFLYPFLGAAAGPVPYWLGSVAIYGWEVLAGEGGLQLLPATVAAALATVLLLDAAPRGGRHTAISLAAAAPPLVLAILGFRYRAVPRPEIFATLLAALVLWAVRRFEDGRPRLLYAFPAMALLWTNLHPSVVAGLAIVTAALGSAALRLARARIARDADASRRLGRDALVLGAVAAAGTLAAFVNPSPASPLAEAARFAFAHYLPGRPGGSEVWASYERSVLRSVPEMQPIAPHFWVEPFGLLLLLTAAVLLVRWRAARLREVVTVAMFAALTFGAARFAVLLAVVCAPIAARSLGEILAALPERIGRLRARAAGALACAAAAVVALPLAAAEPTFCAGGGLRPGAYPVRGVDYLEKLGFRGRLFNTFQFGGYLEWRGVGPPYQDGRGMILPGEERAAMAGPLDRHAFLALDRKYRFDALLLAYPDESPASTARLQSMFGEADWAADRTTWSLVAFDDGGLLYLRRDGAYADRAAADEYVNAMPANAAFSPRPERIPALLAEFRRSAREAPRCALCRYYEGVAALSMGLAGEAREALAAISDPGCAAHPLPVDDLRTQVQAALQTGGR